MHTRGSSALLLPLTRGRTSLLSPLKQKNRGSRISLRLYHQPPIHIHFKEQRWQISPPLLPGHLSPPNRWPKEMPHNWGGRPRSPHRPSIQPHQDCASQLTGVDTTTKTTSMISLTPSVRAVEFPNAPTLPLHPQLPSLCQLHPLLLAGSHTGA